MVVALLATSLTAAPTDAQERLGTIDFPTSGDVEAQSHFIRGVLFMHSFEFGPAAQAFRDAQNIDNNFAMAYWGEAMTYNHPLWQQQDSEAAKQALARLASTPEARAAFAPTEREKGYLAAVEALYGEGSKGRRDTLYSRAMARLVRQNPDDVEAQAFYALSILGLTDGDRDFATYMKAASVALPIFATRPDHPGAAHYIIHSFDDPAHAPLGLPAARAYSTIAPDAPHAQHMTSHIFVALGMWDDVVGANETATVITSPSARARWPGLTRIPCGHYAEWLLYGYLQQGRPGEAETLWKECRAAALDESAAGAGARRSRRGSLARMRASYLVDAEDWQGDVASDPFSTEGVEPYLHSKDDMALGLAALHGGDRAVAERSLDAIQARLTEQTDYGSGMIEVLAGVLRTAILFEDGQIDEAIATGRSTAELEESLPFAYGPPMSGKPPRELIAEILAAAGRHAEAVTEFERALDRTPNRSRSMLGLARAADASGQTERAAEAYAILAELWRDAEPGLAGRDEVERRVRETDTGG